MKVAFKSDKCRVTSDQGRGSGLHATRNTQHVLTLQRFNATPNHSQRAVALVITLILLAVITFMAIAFLVLSTNQRNASVTAVDQQIARLGANNAFERAMADVQMNIFASSNEFNYGLLVPTNYFATNGFTTAGVGYTSPTNVNYFYTTAGAPLTGNDVLQNIANLLYNPRPPVFIVTNRLTGSNDFRFYLDLNRNGRFEPTGWFVVTNGVPGFPPFATTNVAYMVGDPQWIGALEFPDRPHAADNRFLYRYTYLVIPVGQALDVNYMHNYAKMPDPALMRTALNDGFFRNQGAGPWEINLASFLVDLNTNYWNSPVNPYIYYWQTNGVYLTANKGTAFEDALSILSYRYAWNPQSIFSASTLFGPVGVNAFSTDYIDDYSAGPPMVGIWWPGGGLDQDINRVAKFGWAGANNTNHIFSSPQDFFNSTKIRHNPNTPGIPTFCDRLSWTGTNVDTYDRYTFYRMLAQLGTDSAPETPEAIPRPVSGAVTWVNSGTNLLVTITNHSCFIGDWVTLSAPNVNYQRSFKVLSVLNSSNVVLRGGALFPPPPGALTVAIDPFENAKLDLNYDNLNTNREAFTNWQAGDFFTATADRLLRKENGLYLGYIPVYSVSSATNFVRTNLYTASVHRLLQMAANIYDSTTNRTFGITGVSNGFPTIFRPLFRWTTNSTLVIAGYREVTNADFAGLRGTIPPPMAELDTGANTNSIPQLGTPFGLDRNEPLVSGFPLIVGAKKGFPTFNSFEKQTAVTVTRKLEFWRKPRNGPPSSPVGETNQMYLVAISNLFGASVWNSYSNAYSRDLQMVMVADFMETITNAGSQGFQAGPCPVVYTNAVIVPSNRVYRTSIPPALHIPPNVWRGFNYPQQSYSQVKYSFVTNFWPNYPVSNYFNFYLQTNSTYEFTPALGFPPNSFVIPYQTNFEAGLGFPVPHWMLNLKTRFRLMLVDTFANRLVDYVNLESQEDTVDLATLLMSGAPQVGTNFHADASIGSMFNTNRGGSNANFVVSIPTYGIRNQIATSLGTNTLGLVWNDPNRCDAINFFRSNLFGMPALSCGSSSGTPITNANHFFAPYEPTRTLYFYTTWAANDPFVHYTVGDLTDLRTNKPPIYAGTPTDPDRAMDAVNDLTFRYEPWGGNVYKNSTSPTKYDLRVKDPGLTRTDDYDYPTNRFPNPGWLGRVHRGTPWQTIYLKSPFVDFATWQLWSGNGQRVLNIGQIPTNQVALNTYVSDAIYTYPTNDWRLFDIFTTGYNNNSALGKLSINQTNLAAWSAVLGGVLVLTNNLSDADIAANPLGVTPQFAPMAIPPAGTYDPIAPPAVVRIVNGINKYLASTNAPRHVFEHLGSILAVPELTVNSPFINAGTANLQNYGLNDAAYERIPQQVLGLLKCDHTPRFVIYSWGQSLKPADHSVLTSGSYIGLCTNYQVTAEVATRAVVRIDNATTAPHAVIENFNILPAD